MRITPGGNTTRDYKNRVPNRIGAARDGGLRPIQGRESGTSTRHGRNVRKKLIWFLARNTGNYDLASGGANNSPMYLMRCMAGRFWAGEPGDHNSGKCQVGIFIVIFLNDEY
jgi:hypothetical protein